MSKRWLLSIILFFGLAGAAYRYNAPLYIEGVLEGRSVPQSVEAIPVVAVQQPAGKARGVVLAVHGQNQSPKSLDSALGWLKQQGFETYRVALTGHRNRAEELEMVSHDVFLQDLVSAYNQARARADQMNVPLVGLGYSQGAALLADLLASNVSMRIEKFLFMAPALATAYSGDLVRALNRYFPNFKYPSAIPPRYRANAWFNLRAAEALFDSLDIIAKAFPERLNRPTHIYIDKDDELVSQIGIEKLMVEKNLSNWKIHNVSVEGTKLKHKIHHLIVDEEAVGPDEWIRMLAGWQEFLDSIM